MAFIADNSYNGEYVKELAAQLQVDAIQYTFEAINNYFKDDECRRDLCFVIYNLLVERAPLIIDIKKEIKDATKSETT